MRILYVATHVPYPKECGGTSHIRGVANELERRGHEVVVCARADPGLDDGEVEGVPVHRFAWRYRDLAVSQAFHRWRHATGVARLAKRYAVDVIYEREGSMGSGATAARLLGLPLAAEVNDLGYHPPTLERAVRIVANSGGVHTIIPERFHAKTVWVHSSVDAGMFANAEPLPLPGLEGRRVVCYTGSLLAWHGIADLARALPLLLARVPDSTLLLVGEPTTDEGRANLAALEGAAREAGQPLGVHRLGLVPYADVPRALAACDLAVAPYNPAGEPPLQRYGFWYSPMKLWEYLAAGRAVVATDLDNIREILGDGRGALVPPGDPGALAAAMADLLGDGEARRAMGERGRRYARANSWEHRVDDYERALLETVGGAT